MFSSVWYTAYRRSSSPARVLNSSESRVIRESGEMRKSTAMPGSCGGSFLPKEGISGRTGGLFPRIFAPAARISISESVSSNRTSVTAASPVAIWRRFSCPDCRRAELASSTASCPRDKLLVSADLPTLLMVKNATYPVMRSEMRERARKIISILARTLSLGRAGRGRGMEIRPEMAV